MNAAAFRERAKALGVSPPEWFCAVCRGRAPIDRTTLKRAGPIPHRETCWWAEEIPKG